MRDGKFKPKRPLRNELYSLVGVMVLPLAILLSFPYAGIGYTICDRVLIILHLTILFSNNLFDRTYQKIF